jgi:hypothetical protein
MVGKSAQIIDIECEDQPEMDTAPTGNIVESAKLVAEAFKVSYGSVRKWIEKGMPYKPRCYDLEEIAKWRGHPLPQRPRSANKKDMVALALNTDMSISDIARVTGFNRMVAQKLVTDVRGNKDLIDQYKAVREDFFAYEELQYLSNITPEKLEAAHAKDLVAMAKTAFDKGRLESGESTENVSVIVGAIKDWKRKKQQNLS